MPENTECGYGTGGAFSCVRRDSIRYVACHPLGECGFITHAFCTRWGGVSEGRLADLNFGAQVGDTKAHLRRNRALLSSAFDLPEANPTTVAQIHGDQILVIDEPDQGRGHNDLLEYDGVITPLPGIAIGIKTADCVPLLMADRKRRVIGAVHAGWRGTALGIAAKAVDMFIHSFASAPEDILVAIGPAIGPCCYEVDAPVFHGFDDSPVQGHAFTQGQQKGKWMLDLITANRFHLQGAGVPEENILSVDICTSCRHDIFFSHRGEGGNTGRQLSFIMLR